MALIDEIKHIKEDQDAVNYIKLIDEMVKPNTTDEKLLAYGMFYMGLSAYKALIKTNMLPKFAALHAASYGAYKQVNRDEQIEMFNSVWKKSAEYQLGIEA